MQEILGHEPKQETNGKQQQLCQFRTRCVLDHKCLQQLVIKNISIKRVNLHKRLPLRAVTHWKQAVASLFTRFIQHDLCNTNLLSLVTIKKSMSDVFETCHSRVHLVALQLVTKSNCIWLVYECTLLVFPTYPIYGYVEHHGKSFSQPFKGDMFVAWRVVLFIAMLLDTQSESTSVHIGSLLVRYRSLPPEPSCGMPHAILWPYKFHVDWIGCES